jgi:hypothetical protein
MEIMKKWVLLSVFFSLALPCFSQESPDEILRTSLRDYNIHHLVEKVFAHTDRNFYLAGEILWFKIYDVDGFFHLPLGISRIAYVEIINENHQPQLQVKLGLDHGMGNGSIFLPLTLNSGNYIFRAYTNWMKNFGPGYFFEKRISIINTQKISPISALKDSAGYEAGFYPEGGHLINSISNTVGFKVTDRYGEGVDFRGWVLGDQGDTLLAFRPLKFGMGHFLFTPVTHRRYRALIQLSGGQELINELPQGLDSGYSLHLVDEDSPGIRLELRQPIAQYNEPEPSVYLFIHTRGVFKWAEKQVLRNGTANFWVEKNKLGDGISQMTVFDEEHRPLAERLYFKYPERKIESDIHTDKPQYQPREKIKLEILSRDDQSKPLPAHLSLAVYHLDSLQNQDPADIGHFLWLSSDLQGHLDSPAFYFRQGEPLARLAMDNLMLTQGWRRFEWKQVLEAHSAPPEFLPEMEGQLVSGKMIDKRTGKGQSNIEGFLSVPGTRTQFRTASSQEDGKIRFNMKDFYGSQEMIVQTQPFRDSNYRIEISSPFSNLYSGTALRGFQMPETKPGTLLSKSISMEVQNLYHSAQLQQFIQPQIDSIPFYSKPDERYLLENYTRFTTMEEVLREYVKSVNVMKKSGKFHLPLSDYYTKEPYDNDPLVLIDGVPFFDLEKLMNEDPLKIRKLDVVARKYFLGYSLFDGIMNFMTYEGDLSGLELDPQALVLDYEGIQWQREFYSPRYESRLESGSHVPDFRELMYWSGDIQTGSTGKEDIDFFSSDLTGKYVIVLQGLTDNGLPVSQRAFFEVK